MSTESSPRRVSLRIVLPLALFAAIALLSASKLWAESGPLIHTKLDAADSQQGSGEGIALQRTRILLESSLEAPRRLRRLIAMIAGIALAGIAGGLIAINAPTALSIGVAFFILAGSVFGEILERSLFFRSEAMPAMPRVN